MFRSAADPNTPGELMNLKKCKSLCRQYFGTDGNAGNALADGSGLPTEPCFSYNYEPAKRVCTLYNGLIERLVKNENTEYYSGYAQCIEEKEPRYCLKGWSFVRQLPDRCTCIQNAFRVNRSNCTCNTNYFPVNGRNACTLCDGVLVEKFVGKCQCVLNAGRTSPDNCACNSGYYRVPEKNACSLCAGPLNRVSGDTCTCAANSRRVDEESCACDPGFIVAADRNVCTKCDTPLVQRVNGACQCKPGAVRVDADSCKCDEDNGIYPVAGNQSVCTYCEGANTRVVNGECECVPNASRESDGTCQCNSGFILDADGGSCICGSNKLEIVFPGWSNEVTWELRGKSGAVLASGGNYGNKYRSKVEAEVLIGAADYPPVFSLETKGRYNDNTATYSISGCSANILSGTILGGQEFTSGPLLSI